MPLSIYRNASKYLSVAAAVAAVSLALATPESMSSAVADTQSASPRNDFWVEVVAEGLDQPWSLVWLPDGDILITEKYGGIRRLRNGVLEAQPLAGTPKAYQVAQSGLLDIALDPDFAINQRVFLSFTEGSAQANRGAIWRGRYTDRGFVDGRIIYRTVPDATKFPFPVAGRILILPDKTFLFTSSDDHDRRALVQRLDNDIGKILRLDRDGRAPADNPYRSRSGARAEIYAIGFRGPLGLTRDPRDGSIWETENGPRGGDELNLVKAGANYGWPIVTHGTEYSGKPISELREAPGMESPVAYWVPSISPSGLTINLADRYPQWKGDFFSGALSGRQLRRITVRDHKVVSQEVLLTELNERIRDVRMGPDGYLYLLTDNPYGRLLRLRPGRPRKDQLARVAEPLSEATATAIFMAMASPPAMQPGDAVRGETLFGQRCLACHATSAASPAGIGPHLAGIMGRKAGQVEGNVSPAMRRSQLVWSPGHLNTFLAGPQAKIPGTTMTTPPVAKGQDRADLIAYLGGLR